MVFIKTLNKVIKEIEDIKNIEVNLFKDKLLDAFEDYNYEGEEEVVGFDDWGDISENGKYKVNLKINHEHSYELTVHISTQDGKITVTNVL